MEWLDIKKNGVNFIESQSMNQHQVLYSISKYLSRFSEQVKILNANGEFSINIHAENILIGILNIIYNCNFENVNYIEGKNYDSIDLRDKGGEFAVQVTSTSNIAKIKHTLDQYIKNEHYKNYKRLIVLILTGRQEHYSQASLDKITKSKIKFEQGKDIVDFSTIYVLLNSLNSLEKILAVKKLLESQFSDVAFYEEDTNIKSFEDLISYLRSYIIENGRTFKQFGPNSGASTTEPLRWDLTLWYKSRRDKILPNNTLIANTIKSNFKLIPSDCVEIFEKLLSHIYAFEKHCEDADFDYSNYQFPLEILKQFE